MFFFSINLLPPSNLFFDLGEKSIQVVNNCPYKDALAAKSLLFNVYVRDSSEEAGGPVSMTHQLVSYLIVRDIHIFPNMSRNKYDCLGKEIRC